MGLTSAPPTILEQLLRETQRALPGGGGYGGTAAGVDGAVVLLEATSQDGVGEVGVVIRGVVLAIEDDVGEVWLNGRRRGSKGQRR